MILCPDCSTRLPAHDTPVCSNCGWECELHGGVPVYLSHRDRTDPMFRDYLSNYDEIASDDLGDGVLEERLLANLATKMTQYISGTEGAEVCDVGCGKGILTRALLDQGARRVTAVDISLSYLSRLTDVARLQPVQANAENLPFSERFDIMVSTDVLEHVLNLGSSLFSFNRALKHGGRLYVRVPFRESLLQYSRHLGCQYRFVHLRSFDKQLMRAYLTAAGFEIEAFHWDNFWLHRTRAFWLKNTVLLIIRARFIEQVGKRLQHPSDVTLWNSRLAALILEPLEIVVVARKVKAMCPLPKGGFELK